MNVYALESFSNYLILEVPEKGYQKNYFFPWLKHWAAHCNLAEKYFSSYLKISKSARYIFWNHKETISFTGLRPFQICSCTGYSFWDQLGNFLHKFSWIFCQFISWTKWVNSGKFMDNCWILCQIMADIKKVYDNLIINNLYQSWRFWTRQIVSWQSATHTVCTEHISLITFQVAQPPVIPLHNKYVQCMYYVLNSLFAPLYLSISII